MRFQDLDLDKRYTYADYLAWKFEETVELIRGKIFRMSPAPNLYHQEISSNLLSRLFSFMEGKGCKVFHAPFDVRLPVPPGKTSPDKIDTVIQPDISVICDSGKLDLRGCLGAPDWIIEILSPGRAKKDTKDKYEVYEIAGVREYWIVYPEARNVFVYMLGEQAKFVGQRPFTHEDQISPATFPELVIDLNQVFPDSKMLEEHYVEYLRM